MAKKTTKTGKALERQVANAYRAMGARKVEHDVELAGHQIDVYIEMETADRSLHRIAVEAKEYSKPVGIGIVRDFSEVVNSLRRLGEVDEGVIVSTSGFSRQARNRAREEGLRLLEPADLAAMAAEAKKMQSPAHTSTPAPEPGPIPPCPYRGLLAFREQDAPFFYGRETSTDLLVETVLRHPPVVAVIGPSGSGKSSLVSAGLLPCLRQVGVRDPVGSADWIVAQCRPGSSPFDELADTLLPLLEPEMSEIDRLIETPKVAEALQQGNLALHRIVGRVLRKSLEANHLLLVIDQFEELYTLCLEPVTRRCFFDVLLAAIASQATRRESDLTLMLTLRADFLGQVLAYRPLADVLDKAQTLLLGPMKREELRAAIVCPAEQERVAFESGLAARILDDVGSEPGNLALLEFALTQLWDRQESGRLTHAAYEAIGKVEGALTHYADEVYAGLSEVEQQQARRVFVQLVRPGEGTEDTRRLATRAELGEAHWELVQKLANARLVVTQRVPAGQAVAEVAHETLIRGWKQLRVWMDEYRTFREWQERLRAMVRQWIAYGRDAGALLRGAPLAEAERWQAERGDDLRADEYAFIEASREAWHREQQRKITDESLAYLGHAADGIAHRINNAVALLPLCVRDIRQHLVTVDAVVDSNLEMIARNALYILGLAEELQKPSRPSEAGTFDINWLIKNAIDAASPPSNIEVITKLDETLPKVQTKKLLTDVFVELITNAVKAMTGCTERVLEIGSRLSEDESIEVWFTDTGKGIPEEEQERLFELFYTTAEKKAPAAGVAKGFGLWWIKTFLAWQGGEISVESEPGKGATFRVRLPLQVEK